MAGKLEQLNFLFIKKGGTSGRTEVTIQKNTFNIFTTGIHIILQTISTTI